MMHAVCCPCASSLKTINLCRWSLVGCYCHLHRQQWGWWCSLYFHHLVHVESFVSQPQWLYVSSHDQAEGLSRLLPKYSLHQYYTSQVYLWGGCTMTCGCSCSLHSPIYYPKMNSSKFLAALNDNWKTGLTISFLLQFLKIYPQVEPVQSN